MNQFYHGDNLQALREHIADESVDPFISPPPFNSNKHLWETGRLLILNFFLFLCFDLLATLAHGQQIFPPRYFYPSMEFDHFTTNKVIVKNTIGKETPVAMAIWVPGKARDYDNQLTDDEIHKLNWQPFKQEVLVDLGPGPGKRNVWLVAKWENPTEYQQEKLGGAADIILQIEQSAVFFVALIYGIDIYFRP